MLKGRKGGKGGLEERRIRLEGERKGKEGSSMGVEGGKKEIFMLKGSMRLSVHAVVK